MDKEKQARLGPIGRRSFILVPALALALVVAGCGGPSGSSPPADDSAPPAQQETESGKSSDGASDKTGAKAEVKIANSQFEPAELTVKAGTTVVWTNDDSVGHQVHDNSNAFKSEVLDQGGAFETAYSAAGTYSYHCHVHQGMAGTIIVE